MAIAASAFNPYPKRTRKTAKPTFAPLHRDSKHTDIKHELAARVKAHAIDASTAYAVYKLLRAVAPLDGANSDAEEAAIDTLLNAAMLLMDGRESTIITKAL
jgi:hypothetical protein